MISETLRLLVSKQANISDAQTVFDALTNKSITKIFYQGDQSIAAIERAYGPEFVIQLIAGMSTTIAAMQAGSTQDQALAAYLSIYFKRLTEGNGLDFSSDNVRTRFDSLVGVLTQDVVNKLKDLGSIQVSLWEQNSTDPEPSLDDVTEAVIAEQQVRSIRSWVSYVKAILANDGNGKTIAELKALIAERE